MTARSLFYKGQSYSVSGEGYELIGEILPSNSPENLSDLLLPLALCNDSHLQGNQVVGDPMEGALLVLAAKGGIDKEQATANCRVLLKFLLMPNINSWRHFIVMAMR